MRALLVLGFFVCCAAGLAWIEAQEHGWQPVLFTIAMLLAIAAPPLWWWLQQPRPELRGPIMPPSPYEEDMKLRKQLKQRGRESE